MRVLLDTCTFLWIVLDSEALSGQAREIFENPENDVYLSTVSTWEIVVKQTLGRLHLPESPERYIPRLREKHGIDSLSLTEETTLYLGRLPHIHRDPFDRMLVCQAIIEGLVLLTPDSGITQYPVRSIW